MSDHFQIPTDLLDQINISNRCPLTVPDGADGDGENARWVEVMHVESTEYSEKTTEDNVFVSVPIVRFRVSDTFSPDPTNAGKRFTWRRQVNWTALQKRDDEKQVMAAEIGLRTLIQLLLAAGVIKDKSEVKSLGPFFDMQNGSSPLMGKVVQMQVTQRRNKKNQELEQEPQRFIAHA